MIDGELDRQAHKKEYEAQWMKKNRAAVFSKVETEFEPQMDEATSNANELRMRRKDEKMAVNDPQRYCADRCLSTGNCDVFEDFYELGPEDVMKFCTDCVLSEDEEPCDVPDAFYNEPLPQFNAQPYILQLISEARSLLKSCTNRISHN